MSARTRKEKMMNFESLVVYVQDINVNVPERLYDAMVYGSGHFMNPIVRDKSREVMINMLNKHFQTEDVGKKVNSVLDNADPNVYRHEIKKYDMVVDEGIQKDIMKAFVLDIESAICQKGSVFAPLGPCESFCLRAPTSFTYKLLFNMNVMFSDLESNQTYTFHELFSTHSGSELYAIVSSNRQNEFLPLDINKRVVNFRSCVYLHVKIDLKEHEEYPFTDCVFAHRIYNWAGVENPSPSDFWFDMGGPLKKRVERRPELDFEYLPAKVMSLRQPFPLTPEMTFQLYR